jgi:tetratricopeptide (TPR) repeat protein
MRRRTDPLAATVAAAALGGFGYWAVHGSFDWFWEFAGLGAPAFALLGIACSLAPRRTPGAPPPTVRRSRRARITLGVGSAAAALGAAYSFAAPWLSERQIQSAARIWPRAPLAAYARLDDAAVLDPLSDRPYLVAGAIAVRFGDLARAEDEFSRALTRVPNGAYATLELGAIASASGDRARSLRLLRRAVSLAPRDKLFREALAVAAHGRRLNLTALDRAILGRAQRLK